MASRSAHAAPRHSREVTLDAVGRLDWVIVACGLAALVLSFGTYYTYSLDVVSVIHQHSTNAWSGVYGWLAAFCAIAASAVLGCGLMVPQLRRSVGLRGTVLGLYLVALVSVVSALFSVPKGSLNSYVVFFAQEHGHGYAYWFSLLVIALGATLSTVQFLHFRAHN
ncbi:hypothetical protein SAMN05892883_1398 [Jatrophihabitans sp. GAS493]|uniref:hypothetical protein n=1 Tax=Jatrophihabitans sp. GAS493 TaxID=1907575 RepID=UPI000BB71B7D|nr:hypothetical protein [Jatrophihabitans sp. GAS493]SOD71938.1 hypothetical protein SAMN05892883_1398 [Jatrophihabitans sp. GAS493]